MGSRVASSVFHSFGRRPGSDGTGVPGSLAGIPKHTAGHRGARPTLLFRLQIAADGTGFAAGFVRDIYAYCFSLSLSLPVMGSRVRQLLVRPIVPTINPL